MPPSKTKKRTASKQNSPRKRHKGSLNERDQQEMEILNPFFRENESSIHGDIKAWREEERMRMKEKIDRNLKRLDKFFKENNDTWPRSGTNKKKTAKRRKRSSGSSRRRKKKRIRTAK